MKILIFLIISINSNLVFGYEHFIGFGYTNCMTCHYNPYGSGPLNDYGKAVSASVISSRDFYPNAWTEEEIVNFSGPFFNKPKTKHIDVGIGVRHLYASQNYGEDTQKDRNFFMMAKTTAVLKNKSNPTLLLMGDIGYDVRPELRGEDGFNTVSREYYLGLRNNKFGIYLGLMDLVYGLRVAEHTSYSRIFNEISTDDQKHGVLFHANLKPFEIGLQFYLGKLDEETESKKSKKGYSTRIDYEVNSKMEFGLSSLYNETSTTNMFSNALHGKVGFGKGSSVIAEAGIINKTVSNGSKQKSIYSLVQNFILLKRGLFWSNSFEFLDLDLEDKNSLVRIGPGIQYFPAQKFEIKLDILNTRNISETFYASDRWDILLNLHLYL